jgi:hypothetical protein
MCKNQEWTQRRTKCKADVKQAGWQQRTLTFVCSLIFWLHGKGSQSVSMRMCNE